MGESKGFGTKASWVWGASALAMVAAAGAADQAAAATCPTPSITPCGFTIEIQGMYDIDETGKSYPVPGGGNSNFNGIEPKTGYEASGKLTYQPPGSPFSFGIGVKYGRTQNVSKKFHSSYASYYSGTGVRTGKIQLKQDFYIVDFEAGKDVGLGAFGPGVTTIGAGLRYAHLDSTTRSSFTTSTKYGTYSHTQNVKRQSDLTGPRVFIRQTSQLPGMLGDEGWSLGWGAGAAVLFGRQSATGTVHFSSGGTSKQFSRNKNQTVAGLDGFLQIAWSPPKTSVSVSAGYKVDAFFGAMDGGSTMGGHQISVIEQGPFVGVSWKLP